MIIAIKLDCLEIKKRNIKSKKGKKVLKTVTIANLQVQVFSSHDGDRTSS